MFEGWIFDADDKIPKRRKDTDYKAQEIKRGFY